jgi:hypothetical protein
MFLINKNEMKIFIQARKDGYNVLYPTPTPTEFYQFASDIQSASANNDAIYYGKNFYTLAFVNDGCIFTKYVIGYDVQRNNLGNVGISVFIPNTEKLSGVDVKTLLDELVNIYCRNYCPDNNICDKREDWLLLTSRANSFDAKLRSTSSNNADNVQTGTKDPAFIYYKSDSELQEYLDKPFYEEYNEFKQVFFVSRNLKDKPENPLNALRHSENDLTGRIDLDNYKLREFHEKGNNGILIQIKNAKGQVLHNKDKIFRNEVISIIYFKQHYHSIQKEGNLNNEDIRKYLLIDEDNKKIEVRKDIELNPEEKNILLEIKDRKGNTITDAEISCKNNYQPAKTLVGDRIIFKGEEIGQSWSISAKKGDNLFSDDKSIRPDNTRPVEIRMHEIKKVEITANDENGVVYVFTVRIAKYNYNKKVNEIIFKNEAIRGTCIFEFKNEAIEETYIIEVSKNEGNAYYSGKKEFCPQSDSKVHIQLHKSSKNNESYSILPGEHGKISKDGPDYSNKEDGSDLPNNKIIPNKGYVFTVFQLNRDEKKSGYAGALVAQYEKQKSIFDKISPKMWGIIGTAVLVIAIGIWALCSLTKSGNAEQPINKSNIQTYVEGNILFLDTLESYKTNWNMQNPENQKNSSGLFATVSAIVSAFVSDGEKTQTDAMEYEEWKTVAQSIDEAIAKRDRINQKDFAGLNTLHYDPDQKQFQSAVQRIDNTKYNEVGEQLGDVSVLNLNQIADKIDSIVAKPVIEGKSKVTKKAESEPKLGKETSTPPTDITAEIIKYINGSELKKEVLNTYEKEKSIDNNLKVSIGLCLKLWSLDGTKNNSYPSLSKKVNKDTNLKDSELKKFLDEMYNRERPQYPKDILGNGSIKTLSGLKDKLNELKNKVK